MLIPRLDPQERIPFLCAAVASACAAAGDSPKVELPLLAELLSHFDGAVREPALFALAKFEPLEEVAPQAQRLLSDPDDNVRRLAQSVLAGPAASRTEGGSNMIVVQKMLFLRHVPLFSVMDSSELGHVALIAREVRYPEGSRIIREGEHGDHMFLIVEGEVSIERGSPSIMLISPK